eukprot:1202935-Amphidinium_carterae.1
MWQPELIQAEADASALLRTSAKDMLQTEGAKARPKPLKVFYQKLAELHVETLQDSVHSDVLRHEVNTQTHLHVLLPLLDLSVSAPIPDGPTKLMLRQWLSRP